MSAAYKGCWRCWTNCLFYRWFDDSPCWGEVPHMRDSSCEVHLCEGHAKAYSTGEFYVERKKEVNND